jgi:hypothetical protein
MNRRLPLGSPPAGAGSRTTSPAAVSRPARRLIGVMLVAAAALDLTRCGLVMVAVRHPASAAGLVVVGLAAAALSVRTARGCQGGQRWAVWAALLTRAAGGRVRLLHPIYDPRHGHRGPRGYCWPWLSWPRSAGPECRETTPRAPALLPGTTR